MENKYTKLREESMEKLINLIQKHIEENYNILTNNDDVLKLNINKLARKMYETVSIDTKREGDVFLPCIIENAFNDLKDTIETEMCNILERK